jgi:hypothetical protein
VLQKELIFFEESMPLITPSTARYIMMNDGMMMRIELEKIW